MVLIGRLICWLRKAHNYQFSVEDIEPIRCKNLGWIILPAMVYRSKHCTFCGKPKE